MIVMTRAAQARARTATLSLLAATAVALGGCSTLERLNPFNGPQGPQARASAGTRVPVLALNQNLQVSDTLRGTDFSIGVPTVMNAWPLPGANPEQAVENVEAAPAFQVAWRRGFGAGTNRRRHVTSPPIIADGRIYVMDGAVRVAALDAATGAMVWSRNITPPPVRGRRDRDREGFGGGIAFSDGKLYVTSGLRQVLQLDAATGEPGWRTRTDAPMHAAPTVYGGRVFAVAVDDNLVTFDTATGAPGWNYQALTEPARLIGASSPAVVDNTVVATFASGEVIALRANNGNDLWNTPLNRNSRSNALSEIRDIVGRPVVFRGDVYAASHAGAFSAIDLRTGTARWTLPVSSISSPWVSGDVVYVTSRAGEVVCVARESGQVYWIRNMNEGRRGRRMPIWTGPAMVNSRLVVANNLGEAVALDPKTGTTQSTLRLGGPAMMPPIAVGGLMYFVTANAQVVAIR